MLIVAVTIKTRPDHREEFVQSALRISEQTRTEAGCLVYRFSNDLTDPNTFYLHEEWESDEAMQRHFKTPGFLAIQERLPAIVAEPISIRSFQASEVPGA
jgi:quinol monooxygenase YgiN